MFGNQTFFDSAILRYIQQTTMKVCIPGIPAVFKYWYYAYLRFSLAVAEIKFDRFVLDYDYGSA